MSSKFTQVGFLLVLLLSLSASKPKEKKGDEIYKNASATIDDRVEDLLSRMSLEDKFWQMFMIPGDLSDGKDKYKHGIFGFQVAAKGQSADAAQQLLTYGSSGSAEEVANKINEIQRYFVEETELGIPIIAFDEALHGLVRDGSTAYPQAIGLAATWNRDMMSEVATAIAEETSSRGIRQILTPVVNIARDVRWGRTEETYGEDPYLSGEMGYSFVSEFEKRDVITTPKHFVANVAAGGRDSYPVSFNERLMEEIYFPAFKRCFIDAGARSVMTSYNSYDGTPCTGNSYLLRDKLKDEWGFNGFVISDAGATGGANVLHFTSDGYATSTAQSIEGGLDVMFQTSYNHYPLFWEAFEKGMISQEAIDDAVRRVLRAKFELGLFENPYIDAKQASKLNGNDAHLATAQKAAQESIVLLKNSNNILPLKNTISRIALLGQDADEARLGGYSGPGIRRISIKQGLEENKMVQDNNIEILHALGAKRIHNTHVVVPASAFSHNKGGKMVSGLKAEYWDNIQFEGTPVVKRIDNKIGFSWTLFSPNEELLPYDWYSARWTGTITAPESGTFDIGIKGDDGYRVYIDNKLIIDNFEKHTNRTVVEPFNFVKGKAYDLRVEFFENSGNAIFKMVWNVGIDQEVENELAKAVQLAKQSDVAVVTVGLTEGEFRDRAFLTVQGKQEELIKRVAATGTPTIVVLVGGSAVEMANWIDEVDGIVDVWYPGDMGGHAVADVLTGLYNPAGRLPITFPKSVAQCPLYYNHKPTGRGDNYNNLTGKPEFPFGFGLSYTSFNYSDIKIRTVDASNYKFKVVATVTNTGKVKGDEVVQLYLRDELASVARPVKELKGFERISLNPGQSKQVEFELGFNELSMLNQEMQRVVESGKIRVMIGTSSSDIKLRDHIVIE